MSKPIFWKKKKKNIINMFVCWIYPESGKGWRLNIRHFYLQLIFFALLSYFLSNIKDILD